MSETATVKKTRFEPLHLVFCALGGLVIMFVVAPLAAMFLKCSREELAQTAADPEVIGSVWLTLWVAMAATLLCAVAAIPFSYLLARRDFPLKRLVTGIIDIPVMIPHSAAGVAVLAVVSRNSLAGRAAGRLGFSFVDSAAGIMAAMAFVSLPFLVNAARDAFAAVPERYEKVALNLGASPARVFFTVSLPLSWRGIVSGLVMMWARGMSEFGAVVIVAYHPIITPVLIFERYGQYGLKYARPVAVIFITICLAVFVLLRLLAAERYDVKR